MQAQNDNTDEIIEEILNHWDDDNWPPRMTVDEYVRSKENK